MALASGLVESRPSDVAHPFDYIMVRIVELRLKHLEVANLEARWGKRYLWGRERRERTSVSLGYINSVCIPKLTVKPTFTDNKTKYWECISSNLVNFTTIIDLLSISA